MKNIAVFGAGYWGKNLIKNFDHLGVLKYVYDESKTARQEQQKLYGLNDQTLDAILNDDDIDGVVICTPAHTHYEVAKTALLSNKNVFIEKPICLNLGDAISLKNIAEEKNKTLMVGHLLNYHGHFIKLLELVNQDEFGKLIRVKSTRKSFGKLRDNENVIWSFAPHDISMINRFVKGDVKNMNVHKSSYFNDNCDAAFIAYDKAGIKVEIDVDWASATKCHKLELYFEEGILVFEDSELDPEKKLYFVNTKFVKDTLMIKNNLERQYFLVKESQPLLNECKHFLDCMKNNIKPITDADESIAVLKTLISTNEF